MITLPQCSKVSKMKGNGVYAKSSSKPKICFLQTMYMLSLYSFVRVEAFDWPSGLERPCILESQLQGLKTWTSGIHLVKVLSILCWSFQRILMKRNKNGKRIRMKRKQSSISVQAPLIILLSGLTCSILLLNKCARCSAVRFRFFHGFYQRC